MRLVRGRRAGPARRAGGDRRRWLSALSRPGAGLATLTWILALYFVISGIGELIVGFGMKPIKGWGWTVFSGGVGLVLGIMIWRQWPMSGAWLVGTLVGI